MRKLLLATVAGMGISVGLVGYAAAQSADTSGDDSSYTTSTDDSSGQSFPTPGQVTVRLNGRVRFYAYATGSLRQLNTTVTGSTAASTAGGNQPTGSGTNKLDHYGFASYMRLYPGFDGVAANGLKYGGAVEIRETNTNSTSSSGQSLAAAGGGLNGSVSATDGSRGQLYVRRDYGYFGTNQLGTVRVGGVDGPTSLYLTGTFENFNDGNWNGDIYGQLPSSLQLVWPFEDVGGEYTTNKIVYLSPQLYGVDFGASFEPSTATNDGINSAPGACSAAGIGCDQLSSSPTEEIQRRKDTGEVLFRYRGSFGGFGIAATGAYVGSGKVNNDGYGPTALQARFKDLSFGDGGLTLTYGGLTVGGHVLGGQVNNNYTLQKAGQKGEFAWLAGASYTIGPVIVGASYVDVVSGGSVGNLATNVDTTGQRREQGISAGGTYSVAPGFAIFLSYLWDQRKEGGYDFVTGATDASHNKVTGSLYAIGTSFAW